MPNPTKSRNPTTVGSGESIPNCHTLAGFAIGTLYLTTMATLHLRALHKTKTCSSERIFIYCQPRLKKKHLLQLGIHGNPAKRDLRKIMGKIRYHYFKN